MIRSRVASCATFACSASAAPLRSSYLPTLAAHKSSCVHHRTRTTNSNFVSSTRYRSITSSSYSTTHASIRPAVATPSSAASLNNSINASWLFLADMHFDKDRLDVQRVTCDWILHQVRRHRPRHIFLLGDTLHTREAVPVGASSAVATFLHELLYSEHQPHVHILVGNHDMFGARSRDVTSLDMIGVHTLRQNVEGPATGPSSTSQSSPTIEMSHPPFLSSQLPSPSLSRLHLYRDITLVNIDSQPVLFVPYHHGEECAEVEAYVEKLKQSHDLADVVCLAHLPVAGATISGISAADKNHGRKYDKSTVSLSTLASFKRTFLGHFHIHQHCDRATRRVLYVGAPMQFNYGDADDERKGFVLYHPMQDNREMRGMTTTMPWKLYKNPHALRYFSKTLAQWQEELTSTSLDSSSASSSSSPSLQPPYFSKFVQIVLPAGYDHVRNASNAAELARLEKILTTKYQVEGVKLKPTERKVGTMVEKDELKDAASKGMKDEPDLPSDELATTSSDILDSSSSTSSSIVDPFLNDIINGDLRPLIQSYLDSDTTITPEQRANYTQTMNQLLDSVAVETSTSSTSTNSTSQKLFRAQLHRLEVTNFLSIQGTLTFDFTSLASGIWYISGRNGSGKSLLLEAVTWALYGKTLRGHEADRMARAPSGLPMDEIVNDTIKVGNENAHVSVKVSFTNGHTVTRTHLYGKAGSTVKIETPQGGLLEGKSSKKLDEESIVDLLGLGYERFVSSVLLSSTTKNFISSKQEEKRRIIEDLLGFSQFEVLNTKCKEVKKEITEDSRISASTKERAQEKVEEWKAQKEQRSVAKEKQSKEIDRITSELASLRQSIDSRLGIHTQLTASENDIAVKKTQEQTKLSDLNAQIDALRQGEHVQRGKDLRNAKSKADTELAQLVKKRLSDLHVEQTKCMAKQGSDSKLKQEQRQKQLSSVQRQLSSLNQILQLRTQLDLAKQKVSALKITGPKWLQTIERVIIILLEWVVSVVPEGLRTRLQNEVIKPLQEVVDTQKANQTVDQEALDQAEWSVIELQNELDAHIDGIADINAHIGTISSLKEQEKELMKPLPTATLSPDDPLLIELSSIQTRIAELDDPTTSSDASIRACLDAVSKANRDLTEYDVSQQSQRTLETQLLSSRSSINQSIASLTQQESTLRIKIKSHDMETQRLEVQKAKKEKELEITHEMSTKLENEIKQQIEEGMKLEASLESARLQFDSSWSQLQSYTFWSDRISDAQTKQENSFRTYCLDRVLGLLNPLFHENLTLFSTSDDSGEMTHSLACQLSPELTLVAAPGATSMDKRSEGQRKRTHLALFLALFTLSNRRSHFRPSFLFLDEAFDALDDDGQKAVNQWIQRYTEENSSPDASEYRPLIFVITHSSYANPGVSEGYIKVERDAISKASRYTLITHTSKKSPSSSSPSSPSRFVHHAQTHFPSSTDNGTSENESRMTVSEGTPRVQPKKARRRSTTPRIVPEAETPAVSQVQLQEQTAK